MLIRQKLNPHQPQYFAVINAGSSSYKFSLFYETENMHMARHVYGLIEGVGSSRPFFKAFYNSKKLMDEHVWDSNISNSDLVAFLIDWIERYLAPNKLNAIGHRMLHGGTLYRNPVIVTPEILENMRGLVHLAPLHQPRVLRVIDIIAERYPQLCQVVCFDTSFHQTNPPITQLYGLPKRYAERGLIRYGFHGLSYEYIIRELRYRNPTAATGRTIIAHLGSGASMCGLIGGKSVTSTMGFTALDGLLMGTRCGNIDPGLLLYLLQHDGMTPNELESLLYNDSGLLGVSGISNDVRDLLASPEDDAKQALDLFVYRIVRTTGSLVAACGGIDAFVFTAGIGEHSPEVRAAVCRQLEWFGFHLDHHANLSNQVIISTPQSPVTIMVIPTNEELMIASHSAMLARRLQPD